MPVYQIEDYQVFMREKENGIVRFRYAGWPVMTF
jgi:hypothetical protein